VRVVCVTLPVLCWLLYCIVWGPGGSPPALGPGCGLAEPAMGGAISRHRPQQVEPSTATNRHLPQGVEPPMAAARAQPRGRQLPARPIGTAMPRDAAAQALAAGRMGRPRLPRGCPCPAEPPQPPGPSTCPRRWLPARGSGGGVRGAVPRGVTASRLAGVPQADAGLCPGAKLQEGVGRWRGVQEGPRAVGLGSAICGTHSPAWRGHGQRGRARSHLCAGRKAQGKAGQGWQQITAGGCQGNTPHPLSDLDGIGRRPRACG